MAIITLDIQVAVPAFTGHNEHEIWLGDLEKFNQALKIFESTRAGDVVLQSIHPDAFRFGLKILNRHRDILLFGHLTDLGVEIYGDVKNSLEFAFELDQSFMWGFAKEFEEMVLSIK